MYRCGGGGMTESAALLAEELPYTATEDGVYLALEASWGASKFSSNDLTTTGTAIASGYINSKGTYTAGGTARYSHQTYMFAKLSKGQKIMGDSTYSTARAYSVFKIGG